MKAKSAKSKSAKSKSAKSKSAKSKSPWTHFWDMHSGGGLKEKWAHVYIEAPEAEARVVFYNRFGHSPDRVSCTCCGPDYSVTESASLAEATAFHRNCDWEKEGDGYVERPGRYGEYMTLDQFLRSETVLVIPASEIKSEERKGEVPTQGYVWT